MTKHCNLDASHLRQGLEASPATEEAMFERLNTLHHEQVAKLAYSGLKEIILGGNDPYLRVAAIREAQKRLKG